MTHGDGKRFKVKMVLSDLFGFMWVYIGLGNTLNPPNLLEIKIFPTASLRLHARFNKDELTSPRLPCVKFAIYSKENKQPWKISVTIVKPADKVRAVLVVVSESVHFAWDGGGGLYKRFRFKKWANK